MSFAEVEKHFILHHHSTAASIEIAPMSLVHVNQTPAAGEVPRKINEN